MLDEQPYIVGVLTSAAGVATGVTVPNARGIGRVVTVRAATAGRGV